MKVKIKYFGRFATEIGKFSEEIDVPDRMIVRDLIEFLKRKYPFLKNEIIEVSIDGKYASENMQISDEIAIYPQISGG